VTVTPVKLLNSGVAGETRWQATARRGQGVWPYKHHALQYASWREVRAVHHPRLGVHVLRGVGLLGLCSKNDQQQIRLSGHRARASVPEMRSQVWFDCPIPAWPFPFHADQWMQMRYSAVGTAVMFANGGS
jgi:hypothetical protein